MKTHLLIICFMCTSLLGCVQAMKREDIFLQAKLIKAAVIIPEVPELIPKDIPPDKISFLAEQEKLVYKAKFLGIGVGEYIFINKGKVSLNGRPAYCFELTVHTLPIFGSIKDRYVAYMDPDNLVVLRHEEYVNKGERLESAVDFDYENQRAVYSNVITGKKREVAIPSKVQDIVTGGFYLRMIPMALGDTAEINIYADGEIYNYLGLSHSKMVVNLAGHRKQEAFLFKSYLFHEGKPVKNISADVYLSTDAFRKPLRAVLKTFFGNVSVVLHEG